MTYLLQVARRKHILIKGLLSLAALILAFFTLRDTLSELVSALSREVHELQDYYAFSPYTLGGYMDEELLITNLVAQIFMFLALFSTAISLLHSMKRQTSAKCFNVPLIFAALSSMSRIVFEVFWLFLTDESMLYDLIYGLEEFNISILFSLIDLLFSTFSTITMIAILITNNSRPKTKDPSHKTSDLFKGLLFFSIVGSASIGCIAILYTLLFVSFDPSENPIPETQGQGHPNGSQTPSSPASEESISQKALPAFHDLLSAYENESGLFATDEIQAAYFAQAVKLQEIKNPAAAQFCPREEMTVSQNSEGVYMTSGYVHVQNASGSTIRTPFSLNVQKDENGEWKCVKKC